MYIRLLQVCGSGGVWWGVEELRGVGGRQWWTRAAATRAAGDAGLGPVCHGERRVAGVPPCWLAHGRRAACVAGHPDPACHLLIGRLGCRLGCRLGWRGAAGWAGAVLQHRPWQGLEPALLPLARLRACRSRCGTRCRSRPTSTTPSLPGSTFARWAAADGPHAAAYRAASGGLRACRTWMAWAIGLAGTPSHAPLPARACCGVAGSQGSRGSQALRVRCSVCSAPHHASPRPPAPSAPSTLHTPACAACFVVASCTQ